MSITEVKATISKMNIRQRGALQRHLADMDLRADEPRVGTAAWRREMARRIDEVRAGKGYTHAEVRTLIEKHCR
jgi:hypothetical protein